jgi:hypothetical protein
LVASRPPVKDLGKFRLARRIHRAMPALSRKTRLCPQIKKSKTDAGNAAKGFVHNAAASAPHYTYDLNGNLTQDKHKNLTLGYNYLNLPQSFVLPVGTITMTYTADGEKLTKAAGANTKNYVSGIEYTGANLEAIYHGEGRLTPNGGNFYYEYTLKDHLGNARIARKLTTFKKLRLGQKGLERARASASGKQFTITFCLRACVNSQAENNS